MCSHYQKISLRFLALIYLILVQYFQYNTGGAGIDLPYNLTTTMGVLIFICWGLYGLSNNSRLKISSFNLWGWLGLIGILTPLFFPLSNIDFFEGHYFFTLVVIFGLLLILDQFTITKHIRYKIIFILVISTNISAGFALLSYFAIFPFDYLQPLTRPAGNFGQVNLLASYLTTGIAATLYLANKPSLLSHKSYFKVSLLISCTVLPFIVVTTLSRIGWISLVLVLILNLLLCFKQANKVFKTAVTLVLLSSLGSYQLISQQEHAEKVVEYKMSDIGQRASLYPLSFKVLKESWLFGTGYGQFEKEIFQIDQKSPLQNSKQTRIHSLTHPHNEVLFIGIQGGMIAFIGLGVLSTLILRSLFYRSLKRTLTHIALLTPLLIHTMLELPLFASTPHLLTLLLLVYLTSQDNKKLTLKNPLGPFLFKPLATIGATGACLFYISGLHTLYLGYLYNTQHRDITVYSNIINPYVHQDDYRNNMAASQLQNASGQDIFVKEKLISYYTEKMKKNPRPANLNNLCLVFLKFGEVDKARKTLSELNRLFPQYSRQQKQHSCISIIERLN